MRRPNPSRSPESRVVAWMKQNKVDIRFVRVLSLLSRVPQYLLRNSEALELSDHSEINLKICILG